MSEVANIPQLRFSEFSGEWEEKKLGELCKFTQGVQIPFSEQLTKYKEGAIRYLYIRDFFTDDFPYYVKDQYPNKVIHTDEIMMVNTGNTAGKAFMGATGVLSNNAFKVSFDKTKVSNIFLFQRITSDTIQRRIKSFFNAGGQPHLGHKNIAIIPMGFASLKEQQKIAAFLTAVDTKIEQLSKKQALFSEYKKGLMQQIFSQAIRFKADDGSTFPEWKEKKLGDIVRFENGKGHEQNISKDGKFIVVNSKFISSQGRVKKYTDTQKSPLNFGDVVMVMSDVPNGKALAKCYYIEQDNLYSLNQRICGLKHKLADTKFIYYRINRHKYFLSFDSGVGQTNLKKMEILNCPLNIPTDIKEQAKIANFLSSVDNKIEQMGKQLDESKQFKKALLQQMFV